MDLEVKLETGDHPSPLDGDGAEVANELRSVPRTYF